MNKYEKRSQKNYDKKAEKYDSTFDGKFTVKLNETLCDMISTNDEDIIADVACGNGRLLYMLAQKNSFKGYGVDLSEKMILEAKKQNPKMNFFVAGCENLPFKNQEIDIMTVCAAFHHFPDIQKFAQEAGRVIKKNGELYIADVYLPTFFRLICNPFVRLSKSGDVKLYSPKEIVELFENNGFVKNSVEIKGKFQLIKLQRI